MARFEITTIIDNTPALVFDLSRSIDLHMISTAKTKERAVSGVTSGLIGLNETVTWRAYHLFRTRLFTSKITAFDFPNSFTDEMQSGDLQYFSHRHIFESYHSGTIMKDEVELEAPFGIPGRLVMRFFLKNYFRKLLIERNNIIKKYAENGNTGLILKTKAH